MSIAKSLAIILIVFAGIAAGLYVGVWVFFIGGIVDVIEGAKADPVNAKGIAWGVAEVLILAQAAGLAVFGLFSLLAAALAGSDR